MTIKIYNTLSRKKEVFRPRKGKRVNLFVCGPTVYDWSHIGHARTYIVFDMFAKFLRASGYGVFYLENITDVDDKIIKRAHQEKTAASLVARKFTRAFKEDMRALGITAVTRYAPASAFIPEIIAQVKRLIQRGFAYAAKDGSIYFRVRKKKDYGKLSRQDLKKLRQFESGEYKEDPRDFALWKTAKPGEPKWNSPWASPGRPRGWGRPGWHIEDTAISEKYFGPQYDLHGGGIDLVFPHHECEIAQQESASGKKPFVRYWMHSGHLKIAGTKMSKSLGNFITIRTLLEHTKPEIFRLLVASTHYRSPLDYTDARLAQAEATWNGLREFITKLDESSPKMKKSRVVAPGPSFAKASGGKGDRMGIGRVLSRARSSFYAGLADDFNTPKALASIFNYVAQLNPLAERLNEKEKRAILAFFEEADAILGIIGVVKIERVPAEIRARAQRREALRKAGRWEEADRIRAAMQKAGWIVEDTPAGPRLKRFAQ